MQPIMTTQSQALESIRQLVGPKGWADGVQEMLPYLHEERGLYEGSAAAVVKPGSTEEVAGILKLCSEAGLGVVPLGGNTGLVGGGVPDFPDDNGIVLSTERLTAIRDIDALNQTITVEAGVILADIQRIAEDAGALFPLSLGAEGSCRIGGNLSTNAGGVQVLQYGNARDLVLGLEVVLADGRIWDGLRALRKDNTGYDLKHLFIGAEGTLGIITAAVLKLFPRPPAQETALCAAGDARSLLQVLQRIRARAGETLTAFEIMNRFCMEIAQKNVPAASDPFDRAHPEYALIELSGNASVRETLETVLGEALEEGLIDDAVVASSSAQAEDLWAIREAIPEAQKHEGGSIKHDVSVPVSSVGDFLEKATELVEKELPNVRVCAFGHAGDGNIHFNLSQPAGVDRDAYLESWTRINRLVHDLVMDMGGSFSAEHGIGQLKRSDLVRYKSDVELDLMRTMKRALDPKNIMNPGKVV
jgi:FAD/FMN-containing dehydrogenase